MNVFYNLNGVGDVLLLQLTPTRPQAVISKSLGDVTLIQDEATEEVIAFNLFKASTYLDIQTVGEVELTEDVVKRLQDVLLKNNVELKLDVDFTPKFVVGLILKKEKHPDADKLSVCKVDIGEKTVQIVCGAPNVEEGQKVVVAKVGAVMPSGMVIRDAELRGVPSAGMICSAKELGLVNAPAEKGILVLDSQAIAGEAFNK